MERKFETFDKVIYRNDEYSTWIAGIYSHITTSGTHVINGVGQIKDIQILPYEGNEYLVGTTDDPVEEVKIEYGEPILVGDCRKNFVEMESGVDIAIRKFDYVSESGHIVATNGVKWNYCVKLKDIDLNNIKSIEDNILKVKNGKLVKVNNK